MPLLTRTVEINVFLANLMLISIYRVPKISRAGEAHVSRMLPGREIKKAKTATQEANINSKYELHIYAIRKTE